MVALNVFQKSSNSLFISSLVTKCSWELEPASELLSRFSEAMAWFVLINVDPPEYNIFISFKASLLSCFLCSFFFFFLCSLRFFWTSLNSLHPGPPPSWATGPDSWRQQLLAISFFWPSLHVGKFYIFHRIFVFFINTASVFLIQSHVIFLSPV